MLANNKVIHDVLVELKGFNVKRVIVTGIIEVFLNIMIKRLIRDHRFLIRGIGTFTVKRSKMKPRVWKMRSGKEVKIENDKISFYFIPTEKLREEIRKQWDMTSETSSENSETLGDFQKTPSMCIGTSPTSSAGSLEASASPSIPAPETTLLHGENQ